MKSKLDWKPRSNKSSSSAWSDDELFSTVARTLLLLLWRQSTKLSLCYNLKRSDLKPSAHQLANLDGQNFCWNQQLFVSEICRKIPTQHRSFFFVRPLSYLMFWFYRTSSDPAPVVYAIQDHPRVHRHHSLPVNQVINTAHSLKKTLRSPFKGHVSFGNKKLRTWPECWSQAALGCWAG